MENPQTPTIGNNIILKRTEDWNLWIISIKRLSKYKRIWEYIDPDVDVLPILTAPIEPSLQAVFNSQGPITLAQIRDNPDAMQLHHNAVKRYERELKEYKQMLDQIEYMGWFIVQTVNSTWAEIVGNIDHPRAQLLRLKELAAPNHKTRKLEV